MPRLVGLEMDFNVAESVNAGRPVLLNMSDICAMSGEAVLTCMGIGSCVGVCALDPQVNVGGMAHIMLPEAPTHKPVDRLGKFADTGLPELLARMLQMGAVVSRIRVAFAGGAHVSRPGSETERLHSIGDRNVQVVGEQIERLGLQLVKTDIGGSMGRSIRFDLSSGVVKIHTINRGEREFCSLREGA